MGAYGSGLYGAGQYGGGVATPGGLAGNTTGGGTATATLTAATRLSGTTTGGGTTTGTVIAGEVFQWSIISDALFTDSWVFADPGAVPGTLTGTASGAGTASVVFVAQLRGSATGTGSTTGSFTLVDTTAPAAPTGLVATGGIGVIALNWNDNAEPDLNSSAPYIVERATASGGPYTQIATTASSDYIDVVTSGVTYYYRVRAQDNAP